MRSSLFHSQLFCEVEKKVLTQINQTNDLVSGRSLGSPRAVGDAIQDFLADNLSNLIPPLCLKSFNASFARRSMADFAFEDNDGCYYNVDFKTHNLQTAFNMPNLTSVQRLARFYKDDKNFFTILMVSYDVSDSKIIAKDCHFVPIEHLKWNCLTIGALGCGQIQIANSNKISIDRTKSRKEWMLELCDNLDLFYPREIEKINRRIDSFKKIRERWKDRID